MKIVIVLGTRPEIIKLSHLIRLCQKGKLPFTLIHSGQHYDYLLSKKFLAELNLPSKMINLKAGNLSQSQTISQIIRKLEKVMVKERPDVVLSEGDTNTVEATALVCSKMEIPFGHIEAGLRSHFRGMPEELNRIVADAIATFNFAPTPTAVRNLKKSDALPESIYLTGNTIVEVTERNLVIAKKKSKAIRKFGLKNKDFVLLTLHRQENVDDKNKLANVLEGLKRIDSTIIYPIHPRTKKNLKKFRLEKKAKSIKHLKIIKPIGYLDFLILMNKAKLILTDSGGIQEEVTVLKKPVLVLRENTERPEILGKFGELVGTDAKKIAAKANQWLKNNPEKKLKKIKSPYGDGTASRQIIDILLKKSLRTPVQEI